MSETAPQITDVTFEDVPQAARGDVVVGEVVEETPLPSAEPMTPDDLSAELTDAGARALAEALGMDYSNFTPEQRAHYWSLATATFNAVLQRGVELGIYKVD